MLSDDLTLITVKSLNYAKPPIKWIFRDVDIGLDVFQGKKC